MHVVLNEYCDCVYWLLLCTNYLGVIIVIIILIIIH